MRHVGKGLKKSSKEIDDGKDKQDTPRYIEFKNKSNNGIKYSDLFSKL